MNEALKWKPRLDEGRRSLNQILIDNEEAVEASLMLMMCGKHLLLTSLVGRGKTMLGKGSQRLIKGGSYGRVSCTPDLLPGDIIGRRIWNEQLKVMEVEWGKAIVVEVLLLDELNRALEKTQSAVLEPLEEGQITIAGLTKKLPKFHYCVATRNPIENKGTSPLSEAVLDRFWMEETLRIPRREGRRALLRAVNLHQNEADNDPIFDADEFLEMRELVKHVAATASDAVVDYIGDLTAVVQTDSAEFDKLILMPDKNDAFQVTRIGKLAGKSFRELEVVKTGPNGEGGLSPRGMIAQLWISAAHAVLDGRVEVKFEDVRETFLRVNRHRLAMSEMARVDRITSEDVLRAALRVVK